jgi:single-stranded DNA-binding protein
MNNVITLGRIVNFRYREDHECPVKSIVYFHLAVKRNDAAENQSYYYLPCKAEGELAERITQQFQQGDLIFIQGEYQTYDMDELRDAGHVIHISSFICETNAFGVPSKMAPAIENPTSLTAETSEDTIHQLTDEIAKQHCDALITSTVKIKGELATIWAKLQMENLMTKVDEIIQALQLIRSYKQDLEDIEKRAIAIENIYMYDIARVKESVSDTYQVISAVEANIKASFTPALKRELEAQFIKDRKSYVEVKLKNGALLIGRIVYRGPDFLVFIAAGDREELSDDFIYNPYHVIPASWIKAVEKRVKLTITDN